MRLYRWSAIAFALPHLAVTGAFVAAAALVLPARLDAAASSGTIDAAFHTAKVCHSTDCLTPTPGTINFRPTGAMPVTVDDTAGIDGIAWGNELGWITFDPTGPDGVFVDPATGLISGKAWSQVSGWINFAPTGYDVIITVNGELSGWAWTGGPYGGWIKFDCAHSSSCVRTDWRPLPARIATSAANGPVAGGNAVLVSPSDLCPNIDGMQWQLPSGFEQRDGRCAARADDLCLNLPGAQPTLPRGYWMDAGGLCLLDIDLCTSLPGLQRIVPDGVVVDGAGRCIASDGIADGVQEPVPLDAPDTIPDSAVELTVTAAGYPQDLCPNIEGMQWQVPGTLVIDDAGACVWPPDDIAINRAAPHRIDAVVAFGFVPQSLYVPVQAPGLARIATWLGARTTTTAAESTGTVRVLVDITGLMTGIVAAIAVLLVLIVAVRPLR